MQAQKPVVDSAGTENEVPMNDWLEVGIYEEGKGLNVPLYLQMHLLRVFSELPSPVVLCGFDLTSEEYKSFTQRDERKSLSFLLLRATILKETARLMVAW